MAAIPRAWQPYRRLMPYVLRYRSRLSLGLLCGLLFAAANGALVWGVKTGLSGVFGERANSPWLVAGSLLMFPVLGLLRGLADFGARYSVRWVGSRVVMDLRNAMFKHLHDLSLAYFSTRRTGELISRVSNDTVMVEQAVSTMIIDLVKQPATLLVMVVWLFRVDARLALVSFVFLPLTVIPVAAFGARMRRFARAAQEGIADIVSVLQETIAGVRVVKAFGMEAYETTRFREQTREYFRRIMHVCRIEVILEPMIVCVATLALAAVLFYVYWVDMEIEAFMAFALALFMLYEPVKKLGRMHMHLQQSGAAAQRILDVMDTAPDVRDRPDAQPCPTPIRTLGFEQVSFAYGAEPVLKDITFEVRAGERVAFVGSSGAGKTTLVNLVPRFYDVTQGRVLINGVDVRAMAQQALRGCIGLVTQETFLFHDTVANNIAYGHQVADRAAIEEAAQRAYAHGFIMEMPQGYETVIGERGVRLSGGQRQRLAIARAILRNPPILILDEATSALDTESERMVQAALNALLTGRTVLAIAHRLSTITRCDRILVLDGGRIVEQGSHDALMTLNGQYRRLYDMQFEVAHEAVS